MSNTTSNRDERGRLLPGHSSPGPGRPPREKEEAILQTIREEATPERVRAVLAKLYEQATVHGSVKAAQLWLGYAAGKPKELGAASTGQANIDLMKQAMLQFNENQRLEQRVMELESAINAKVIEGVTHE